MGGLRDTDNLGRVFLEALDGSSRTKVSVAIEYGPEGALEVIGDAVGLAESRICEDLARFKEFIESRGATTGAWRR